LLLLASRIYFHFQGWIVGMHTDKNIWNGSVTVLHKKDRFSLVWGNTRNT
jgi:hypothetical protein